MDVNIKRYKN